LKTADEAALSAEARGMGTYPQRTYFDARQLEELLAAKGIVTGPSAGGESARKRPR
jgi:hypothetical protein